MSLTTHTFARRFWTFRELRRLFIGPPPRRGRRARTGQRTSAHVIRRTVHQPIDVLLVAIGRSRTVLVLHGERSTCWIARRRRSRKGYRIRRTRPSETALDGRDGQRARTGRGHPDETAPHGRFAAVLNPPSPSGECGFKSRPGHADLVFCGLGEVVCASKRTVTAVVLVVENVRRSIESGRGGNGPSQPSVAIHRNCRPVGVLPVIVGDGTAWMSHVESGGTAAAGPFERPGRLLAARPANSTTLAPDVHESGVAGERDGRLVDPVPHEQIQLSGSGSDSEVGIAAFA